MFFLHAKIKQITLNIELHTLGHGVNARQKEQKIINVELPFISKITYNIHKSISVVTKSIIADVRD